MIRTMQIFQVKKLKIYRQLSSLNRLIWFSHSVSETTNRSIKSCNRSITPVNHTTIQSNLSIVQSLKSANRLVIQTSTGMSEWLRKTTIFFLNKSVSSFTFSCYFPYYAPHYYYVVHCGINNHLKGQCHEISLCDKLRAMKIKSN